MITSFGVAFIPDPDRQEKRENPVPRFNLRAKLGEPNVSYLGFFPPSTQTTTRLSGNGRMSLTSDHLERFLKRIELSDHHLGEPATFDFHEGGVSDELQPMIMAATAKMDGPFDALS